MYTNLQQGGCPAFADCRCQCGKLMMIKTRQGYELKCGRCKGKWMLGFEEIFADYTRLTGEAVHFTKTKRAARGRESRAPSVKES